MKSRKHLLKILLVAVISIQISLKSTSQTGMLIGIVDNNLVEINPNNAPLRQIQLVNIPPNKVCLYFGLFAEKLPVLYTYDPTGQAVLASINWQGEYTEIGPLSLPGETIYFAEAMSQGHENNKGRFKLVLLN